MTRVRFILGVAAAFLLLAGAGIRTGRAADEPSSSIPVLAYYYIWFQEQSWERAKTDYPQLGRYNSDDTEVMRQHIRWAKDAGIDGFIVSWKSTVTLDRRLERLIQVAGDEDFKLAIIYQGLDFHRDPLPIERIAADIDHFLATYGGDPVFELFDGPPVLIWSGTWEFTPDEIDTVTQTRSLRSGCDWKSDADPTCVRLLATEKNPPGIERLRGLVDGNAYYWSSVNPDTFPGYQEKLDAMSEAVHVSGGLWIAPAAPGFDARLIGGTTVVDREGGEMFRRQLDAAYAATPDAIGVISWNEFSENSHIEPSEKHGMASLEVLADITGGSPSALPDLDSSQPDRPNLSQPSDDVTGRVLALGMLGAAIGAGAIVIARRQRAGARHG
jgi:Glycosyl hydrolase family 99